MKKVTIILVLIISVFISKGQNDGDVKLSNEAEISLITCSPGAELYSLFGHSAMRVYDPVNDVDAVFNYGTFSFDEDFYFNFAMGQLNYKLSISPMDRFVQSYEYEGRGVIEQKLDLSTDQKQAIVDFLLWNAKPENRFYLYDFFYDNCSSILRDVLDTALQGEVRFADLTYPDQPSYRTMIDSYLVYHPWGDFGIDLGLGLPCDKTPNYLEYMFLPDELSKGYDHATIDGHPLVSDKKTLLDWNGLQYKWSLTQPIPLFWLCFVIIGILSAIGIRLNKRFAIIDILLLLIYGAVGALIFFLWFITDHNATANNFNMLWALPTHLLMIPLLWNNTIRRQYFVGYGILLTLTLIGFPFFPQVMHAATIPLMLIMLMRVISNYIWAKRNSTP